MCFSANLHVHVGFVFPYLSIFRKFHSYFCKKIPWPEDVQKDTIIASIWHGITDTTYRRHNYYMNMAWDHRHYIQKTQLLHEYGMGSPTLHTKDTIITWIWHGITHTTYKRHNYYMNMAWDHPHYIQKTQLLHEYGMGSPTLHTEDTIIT